MNGDWWEDTDCERCHVYKRYFQERSTLVYDQDDEILMPYTGLLDVLGIPEDERDDVTRTVVSRLDLTMVDTMNPWAAVPAEDVDTEDYDGTEEVVVLSKEGVGVVLAAVNLSLDDKVTFRQWYEKNILKGKGSLVLPSTQDDAERAERNLAARTQRPDIVAVAKDCLRLQKQVQALAGSVNALLGRVITRLPVSGGEE